MYDLWGERLLWLLCRQQQITERIRLRAFGTPHKFPFGELQIRSERYRKYLDEKKAARIEKLYVNGLSIKEE